jgi:hypothetical protein
MLGDERVAAADFHVEVVSAVVRKPVGHERKIARPVHR